MSILPFLVFIPITILVHLIHLYPTKLIFLCLGFALHIALYIQGSPYVLCLKGLVLKLKNLIF